MQTFIELRCDVLDEGTELVVISEYGIYGSNDKLTSSVQVPEFEG